MTSSDNDKEQDKNKEPEIDQTIETETEYQSEITAESEIEENLESHEAQKKKESKIKALFLGIPEKFRPLKEFIDEEGFPFGTAFIFFFIIISPCAFVYIFIHPEGITYVDNNKFPEGLKGQTYLALLISFIFFLMYLAVRLCIRRNLSLKSIITQIRHINRYFLPLIVLPLFSFLLTRKVEVSDPFMTLIVIGLIVILATVWFRNIICASPFDFHFTKPTPTIKHRILTWTPLLAMIGIYTVYVTYLSYKNVAFFNNPSFDLSIYENLIYSTAHGDFLKSTLVKGGTHLTSHFDPFLVFLAPLVWIWPDTKMILGFQSFWLATSIIPLFLLSKRLLGFNLAIYLVPVIFLLHPAIHGINMFEFHSLALSVPLFIWLVYFIDTRSNWGYWTTFVLLLLVREDMSLLLITVGLYTIFAVKQYGRGLLTILLAFSYLFVVKAFIMADSGLLMDGSNQSYDYSNYFSQMITSKEGGIRDLFFTVIANPLYTLEVIFSEKKIAYFFTVAIPFLMLSFLTKQRLLLLLYPFLFHFLGSHPALYSLYVQYPSFNIAFMSVLFIYGLVSLGKKTRFVAHFGSHDKFKTTMLLAAFTSTLLISWKYGAFLPNDAFRIGSNWGSKHHQSLEDHSFTYNQYQTVLKFKEMVPDDAAVASSRFVMNLFAVRREIYHLWRLDVDYIIARKQEIGDSDFKRFERALSKGMITVIAQENDITLYKGARKPKQEESEN